MQVERILNEPTAAAIAYGFHEAREDKKLLIFDLGGGTFDVSVVELFDGLLVVVDLPAFLAPPHAASNEAAAARAGTSNGR